MEKGSFHARAEKKKIFKVCFAAYKRSFSVGILKNMIYFRELLIVHFDTGAEVDYIIVLNRILYHERRKVISKL